MTGKEILEEEFKDYGAMLKSEEVATLLSISRCHAYRLLERGEIPSIKIGQRNMRVLKEDLINYLITSRENSIKNSNSIDASNKQEAKALFDEWKVEMRKKHRNKNDTSIDFTVEELYEKWKEYNLKKLKAKK